MPRRFTLHEVTTHNHEHPDDKYAVIHGDVYRIGSIPFNKCPFNIVTVEAALINNVDVSPIFGSHHTDGSTVRLLKSTQGCQVGTIVQEQRQPAHHAPPVQLGHQGQNDQGQPGQPDADDDEGGTAAERRRREEARNRRLRKTYNPLRQDPDDADEYPADAVAMGYLPDLEGRRWREKRMRLSRIIQYTDMPAIDEEDVSPDFAAAFDLDFAKEIRYQRNLKGGEARGCTGSFRVARPPPPRSQLRPRDGGRTPGGPPPRDPPDSDADDDDGDDDAPDVPAARARQVQVEGRVRQWFPSNSNRTGPGPTQLATPPVTPLNPLPQRTVQPPLQPPPPPPQIPQQLTFVQEQEIAKQRRREEKAAADKAIVKKQKNPAVINETVERFWTLKKGNKATQNKPQAPKKSPTRKQDEEARKKRQERRLEEQRKKDEQKKKQDELNEQKKKQDELNEQKKKQDELDEQKKKDDARKAFNERKKQKEAVDAAKRKRENEAAQKEADEQRKRIQEDSQQRLNELDPQAILDATRRAEETQRQQEAIRKLDSMRDETSRITKELSEKGNQEMRDKLVREQQEGQRSQAENRAQFEQAERATYAEQQTRIKNFIEGGYTRIQAETVVSRFYGGLLEDPDKKAQNKRGTTTTPKGTKQSTTTNTTKTPPKRPAETTGGGQGSNKKIRWEDQQQTKTDQAGDGGGKYGDSNRPYKKGEEPYNKGKAPQKTGFPHVVNSSDDEDSPDELATVVTTGARRPTGGPSSSRPDLPDLPSDAPPAPNTTGTADTISRAPTVIPPPGGIPTTTTATTTGGRRRPRGVGLRPGSEGAAKLQDMIRNRDTPSRSNAPSSKR